MGKFKKEESSEFTEKAPERTRYRNNKKEHSVPVPRFYKDAAKILRRFENKEGSVKQLVYNSGLRDVNRVYGLLSRIVENATNLKLALARSRLLSEEPKFDPCLAQVLVAELQRKGTIEGQSKPVLILQKYQESIMKDLSARASDKAEEEKQKVLPPKYVRVNTLVSTLADIHTYLQKEGFRLVGRIYSYEEFLFKAQNLEESEYMIDHHIDGLLVFAPNIQFWKNEYYRKGALVLQDKASCLPVFLSNIVPDAKVIDACAAPGNKTSQIAAIMENKGTIIAVEKHKERFSTLKQLLNQRHATCVTPKHKDFSKLSRDKYNEAEFIFVDPTCSNSGTKDGRDSTPQQLKQLASFQAILLKGALSYPQVQEVIYSTCSINEEENEKVVQEALEFVGDKFELEDLGAKLDGWQHFGKEEYDFGSKCVRTVPEIDMCHGFFVAKFVRKNNPENEADGENMEQQEAENDDENNDENNDENDDEEEEGEEEEQEESEDEED